MEVFKLCWPEGHNAMFVATRLDLEGCVSSPLDR